MAAQGDPGRDHGDQDREAAEAREDTEVADQRALREVLDQLRPGRSLRFRPPVQLTREDRVGGPLQRLPSAEEDDEGDERDPAHASGGPLDPAQKKEGSRGQERDEEHHADVHDERGGHLILEVQVDLIGLALWMEEEEDRPGERHPDDEGGLAAADSWLIHEPTPSVAM